MWTEARRRAELVAVGAILERRGLVRGREGNLSCRLGSDRVLLTPRGVFKGRLQPAELVVCTLDGPLPAAASSEVRMHLEVYRRRPAVEALVHAHPMAVLALQARAAVPEPHMLAEGQAVVQRVARVPALAPGSRELAEACAEALGRAPVAVLAKHGILAGGADPWEALERVEVTELLAQLSLRLTRA